MMRTFVQAAVVFALLPVLLFAGTTGKIAGTVMDKESKQPLPSVNVLIEGTTLGAATDLNGQYFILNVPSGKYTVVATIIGYQSERRLNVQVSIDLTTTVNFSLSSTVLEAGVVEVVAERPLLQRDMTATQSIVGGTEVANAPVNSYEGALVQTAGFIVAGGSEGGTVAIGEGGGIHVRGERGGTLGYLIDGFYVEDALFGGVGSDVTRDGIQELSVVTGTFNAEYGEALAGVVNIVTKEGGTKYEGKLRFATDNLLIGDLGDHRVNNWETTRGEVSVGGPVPFTNDRVKFYLSGDRYYTNTYLNLTKHTLAADAPHFTAIDSIAELYLDENDVVQLPDPTNPNLRRQKQVAGATHYHNNNTYNRQWRSTGKLTFSPSNTTKLLLGYTGSQQHFKNYDITFKPNPERANRNEVENLLVNATWNHTLSTSTFYTLKAGLFNIWSRTGRFKPTTDLAVPLFSGPFNNFPFAAFGGQSNYEFQGAYPHPEFNPNNPKPGTFVVVNGDTVAAPVYSEESDYFNYRSRTATINFDLTSQVSRVHQIKTGFEFKQLDLRNHQLEGINYANDTTGYRFKPIQLAAYIQDKIELKDMVLNIGLRWDYLDPKSPFVATSNNLVATGSGKGQVESAKKKSHISPRIGFGYPIVEKAVLHFAYGMFTQNPDYSLFYRGFYKGSPIYPYPDIAEHFIVGNPNLKPERSTVYELGTDVQLTDDIGVDVTLYYKDVYDYVSTLEYPFAQPQNYFTFVNLDYANARGLEISMEKRFSHNFGARLTYTYSRAEGNAQSEFTHYNEYINQSVLQEVPPKKVITLAWDQPHTLNFNIDVRQPANWGINLYGRFGSGLPYSPTDARGRLTDERNSARLPWFGSLDVRANKEFHWSGLNLNMFLDVTNVFDRRNVLAVFATTGSPTATLLPGTSEEARDRPHWFGQPRHFEAGVEIGF
jgi:outer membrane receptor protein involved in Fe transport